MAFRKRIAALDIGQTATKLVIAERRGRICHLVESAIFRNRDEGLMDQTELSEHLSSWLDEQDVEDEDYVVGLPQYLAMTQVSDFPPTSGAQLEEMVALETQQLGGLTDEIFIHDYQRLQPFHHFKNPVLIAVCRDALLENRLELFEPAALKLDRLHMEGHALVAAFFMAFPDEDAHAGLRLLMDVGAENTTMVLLLDGQVLHMNSFLFGGDFFTEALTRHLGISQMEAEKSKHTSELVPDDTQSPLTRSGQNFIMELEGALDNWRSHDPDAVKLTVAGIYLSGGGACLKGVDTFLGNAYGCDVLYIQSPQFAETEYDGREFNIALGLAAQALDLVPGGAVPNLLPADHQWISRRRKRIPYLYAAVFLLCIILAGWQTLAFLTVEKERIALSQRRKNLEDCQKEFPGLLFAREKIDSYQEKLRPFAARGNRNEKFIESIYVLSQARQRGDWIYLIADYPYGYEERDPTASIRQPGSSTPITNPFASDTGNGGEAMSEIWVDSTKIRPWTSIVVSGFTPGRIGLENVRKMREQLNQSPLFLDVDSNPEISALDSRSRRPWLFFRMRPFSLICPFEESEFVVKNGGAKRP